MLVTLELGNTLANLANSTGMPTATSMSWL